MQRSVQVSPRVSWEKFYAEESGTQFLKVGSESTESTESTEKQLVHMINVHCLVF